VLKRRRLSNDNETQRWEMRQNPTVQVEGVTGSLDGGTLETSM